MDTHRSPTAGARRPVTRTFTRVAVLAALVAAGCQSTGSELATSTVKDLKRLRLELVDAQASIGQVTTALDALAEKGGNLDAEFQAYRNAVDGVASGGGEVRSIRRSLAENRKVYLENWEEGASGIQDERLRDRAMVRRDDIAAGFDELRADGDALRTAFDAWLLGLTDARTYLDFDLNPSGVASMRGDLDSLSRSAGELDGQMSAFVAELAVLIESLAVPVTAGS